MGDELAYSSLWSPKPNCEEKSQSHNGSEWGVISSRNEPEMALYRTLPDLTFSQLQWDLGPRLGETQHSIRYSKQFTEELKSLKLEPDEEMRSCSITNLFQ